MQYRVVDKPRPNRQRLKVSVAHCQIRDAIYDSQNRRVELIVSSNVAGLEIGRTLGSGNRDVAARSDFCDWRAYGAYHLIIAEVECADAAEVSSKLKRVRSARPCRVVEELVHLADNGLSAPSLRVNIYRLIEQRGGSCSLLQYRRPR